MSTTPLVVASHEIGHYLVAEHNGIHIEAVGLEVDGESGYTIAGTIAVPRKAALQVAVAGFVAEELAQGSDIDISHFLEGPQYEDDCNEAFGLMEGMRMEIALPHVISQVAEYLTTPVVQVQSKRLVKRLLRNKRLTF
jgi:hypothetical protein